MLNDRPPVCFINRIYIPTNLSIDFEKIFMEVTQLSATQHGNGDVVGVGYLNIWVVGPPALS